MKQFCYRVFFILLPLLTLHGNAPLSYGSEQEALAVQSNPNYRTINPIHMLVVFTRFRDEAPSDSLAPWWAQKLFDGKPGSINYFFEETSHGQIDVTGEYLPIRYELPHIDQHYIQNTGQYSMDLLKLMEKDPDVDFSFYDNDGPDGIPSSGDDDGYVDFMVFMPRTRPYDFITKNATGVSHLSLPAKYTTDNADINGRLVKIDSQSGCIGTAINYHQATGTICHEYTHAFGTFDLYDTRYDNNDDDSAGIGNWGVMGRGILGWHDGDGPTGPSAYTRYVLGTIGHNNQNLIDIYGVHREIRLKDSAHIDGRVYRVWIGKNEYFLISHRSNKTIYADRHVPQNGLLIWHVYDTIETNNDEMKKAVDLECADGRYSDAGYPLGKIPDPVNGFDNLDFWSHTTEYNTRYAGNLGDATDVFDGVKYTRFGMNTNPNTHSKVNGEPSGIEIFNIRRDGDEMVFDINSPPVTEWHNETYPQIGLALHRFNIPLSFNGLHKQDSALYILKHSSGTNEKPITTMISADMEQMSVADISALDEFSLQREIENRLFQDRGTFASARILRENISIDTYREELSSLGAPEAGITFEDTPAWIQKITLETGADRLPVALELNQNFPNPFNDQTLISFTLPESGPVTLEVYNVLGQQVAARDLGSLPFGNHSTLFNADGLASGVYFYRLTGISVSEPRKFILLR